jgi:putative DNA-invertase from lambdoid prophage Rac
MLGAIAYIQASGLLRACPQGYGLMNLEKVPENRSAGVGLPPMDKVSKDGAFADKKKASARRTVLYARVSTAEQTLAHQRAQAEAAGYRIDEVVADHGVSGVSTTLADRPEGRRLFDLLRAGDTLVVRWVDRLGRNYRDVTDTIREFMRRGVVIRTVINGMVFDGATNDPMQQAVREVPADATKTTHKLMRERCKAVVLGINYGMGPEAMALQAGITPAEARELLRLHNETYRPFWRWIGDTVSAAMLTNRMQTVFGWRRRIGRDANPRSLMNFPCKPTVRR